MNDKQQSGGHDNSQEIRSRVEQATDPRVDLAVQRTELALDRTQLAWVRTAFSFITAGLAIDKGAQALHAARVLAGTNWVNSSHAVGIVLTLLSTIFLIFSSVLYYQQAYTLARLKGITPPRLPLPFLISLLVVLLGITLSLLMLTLD